MAGDNEELTTCTVCFEFYTEDGDHIPRLLPCHHTLCENCIKELLQKKSVVSCPECRRDCTNVSNVKEFKQNKYILSHIREKRRELQKAVVKKHLCAEHGIELYFYCKEISCRREICPSCWLDHKNHDVIHLDQRQCEEQCGKLMANIETLTNDLHRNQQELLQTKHKINADYKASTEYARDKRIEYIKIIEETFKKMFDDAAQQTQKVNRTINEKLGDIDLFIAQLNSMKESTNGAAISRKEIDDRLETFQKIEREADKKTATVMGYMYPQYNDSNATTDDVKSICGYLTETEVLSEMLRACSIETGSGSPDVRPATGSWQDARIMSTNFSKVGSMCLQGDGRIVLCAERNNSGWGLLQYSIRIQKSFGTRLHALYPREIQIADIVYDGRNCLAVSYGREQQIEFRDADDLNRVVSKYSMGPGVTPCMRAGPNGTLLLEDTSGCPGAIRWIDYNNRRAPSETRVTHDKGLITGMCIIPNKRQPTRSMLITTYCKENESGIRAYNSSTGQLQWSVPGSLPQVKEPMYPTDITADGCHHLFVCDVNNSCVHVFSIDGSYLRAFKLDVITAENQAIATPLLVRWSSELSSLVVVCKCNETHFIALVSAHEIREKMDK